VINAFLHPRATSSADDRRGIAGRRGKLPDFVGGDRELSPVLSGTRGFDGGD
jgi:hypothetical protein